jgi:hypothetical protein
MDTLTKLKHEMRERLDHDVEQRKQGTKPSGPQLDDYESVKEANPGHEVFALAVGLKCPLRTCDAVYPVGLFVTYEMGEQFHFPCRKCGDAILTVRDTFRTLPKNTFPVEKLQEKMRANPGKYDAWIKMLKAAYDAMAEAGKQVWDEARYRESTIAGGSGSKRDVKMRMTVQTPEEALREMKPTTKITGRHDPMREMSMEGVADFFGDQNLAGKYKG